MLIILISLPQLFLDPSLHNLPNFMFFGSLQNKTKQWGPVTVDRLLSMRPALEYVVNISSVTPLKENGFPSSCSYLL